MAVSSQPLTKIPRSIGLIAAHGGRQILAQRMALQARSAATQIFSSSLGRVTTITCGAAFDFSAIDMISYGVCEL